MSSSTTPQETTSTATVVAPYPPQNLLKGALIATVRGAPNPSQTYVVPFQYNPQTLSRTLTPSYYRERSERFTGPAKQTIDVTVQLEASGSPDDALGNGVLAYLAALEMMINPSSTDLETYVSDTQSNKMKAVPPLAPRSLFVWGPNRLLPVRLTSMTATEKLFGPNLSPIVADVALKMELYPFKEADDKDYQLLLTNLKLLETLRADVPTTGADLGVDVASAL